MKECDVIEELKMNYYEGLELNVCWCMSSYRKGGEEYSFVSDGKGGIIRLNELAKENKMEEIKNRYCNNCYMDGIHTCDGCGANIKIMIEETKHRSIQVILTNRINYCDECWEKTENG